MEVGFVVPMLETELLILEIPNEFKLVKTNPCDK